MALVDDILRDLYWCVVLKFMRDLYLTTPSAAGMLAMLGSLEPMSNHKEHLLEDCATLEKELDRQEIYRNHREVQAALVHLQ